MITENICFILLNKVMNYDDDVKKTINNKLFV